MSSPGIVQDKNLILRKKVILTHEFAPFRGGAATFCAETARAASGLGQSVEVWTPGETMPADDSASFVVKRLGGRGSLRLPDLIHFGWQIVRRRKELRGSRVILGSVGAQILFLHFDLFGLLREIEVAPLFHGSEVLRYQRNPWLKALARRWLARRARIFASSEYTARLLQQSGLLPAKAKVEVAPCAVRSDLRVASEQLPKSEPHAGPLRILTLARLHPRKGQLETARALAALPEETRRQVLYQIGGTGDRAYLREVEKVCEVGGVPFLYLGEIPDERLAETYAQCDLYVMTSRALKRSVEGFGMTYLEAGLFGKPVIGTRSGGIAEAVRDGETGFLVEEGDQAALTEALRRLIEDADLRCKLGGAGRAYSLSRTWETAARVLFG